MKLPRQADVQLRFSVLGVILFANIVTVWPQTLLPTLAKFALCVFTLPGVFLLLQRLKRFEGRSWAEIGGWRHQSWALYGDIVLGIALTTANNAWADHQSQLPWWSLQWWWVPVAGVLGLGFGWLFRLVDNRNYDPASLLGPAKWIHDRVLIPAFAGALFARAVPLLWHWDVYTKTALTLVGCWIVLAIIDGFRMQKKLPDWAPDWLVYMHSYIQLVAERQHPYWHDVYFRFMTTAELQVYWASCQLSQ